MLFNSIEFAVFVPVVFALYWGVPWRRLRDQSWLVVCASYLFYGWWDARFLALILLSTVVDYSIGLALETQSGSRRRRLLLAVSVLSNIGISGSSSTKICSSTTSRRLSLSSARN